MINLAWEKGIESVVNTQIISQLKQYEKLIVFGAGESGSWVVNLLRENDIYPVCFCDNYPGKWGKEKNGLKIESFEAAIKKYGDVAICIASMRSEDIVNQIGEYDRRLLYKTWDLLTTMAWETSNNSYVSDECRYIKGHILEFENLSSSLADDCSRETLAGILNYRLTRDKRFLREIKSSESIYLDKSIIPEEYGEITASGSIIDGGAFDGDTADYFVKTLGKEKVLDIHCYEAENRNCKKIKERLPEWEPHRITVHQKALWSSTGEILNFEGDGLSGRIGQKQQMGRVLAEKIDDYNYDHVSLIKLDIEGGRKICIRRSKKHN